MGLTRCYKTEVFFTFITGKDWTRVFIFSAHLTDIGGAYRVADWWVVTPFLFVTVTF